MSLRKVGTRTWFDFVKASNSCDLCEYNTTDPCPYFYCEIKGQGHWKKRIKETKE